MLHLIQDITDNYLKFINDDPVRPNIPVIERVGNNKDIFILCDDGEVAAITCVSYQREIPTSEEELFRENRSPSVAVFYTIWSYKPGAGRELILNAVDYLLENNNNIKRFVTLSPKTEMARRFHLKNGAVVLQENPHTVNYEYRQKPLNLCKKPTEISLVNQQLTEP